MCRARGFSRRSVRLAESSQHDSESDAIPFVLDERLQDRQLFEGASPLSLAAVGVDETLVNHLAEFVPRVAELVGGRLENGLVESGGAVEVVKLGESIRGADRMREKQGEARLFERVMCGVLEDATR